jgi:hypothetical protein
MHHEILVHNDMPKIDYCVLTVAGNPTMSGGGGKKTQHPLASFFSPTTGPAPASHRPLRTPGSSAQLEAKTSVTAVATQFFAKLWGTNLSRPVGAPTADRKERERAVGILSTSFGEWYLGENPAASSNVAEGTDNKRTLMNCVEVWWNSSSQALELRLDNQWSAGSCPTVFHQPGASACSSADGGTNDPQAEEGTNAPHKAGKGIEDTEHQELNRHGYDSDGSIMVLVKSYMHKWGKPGVKGGEHLGWRTVPEWAAKVGAQVLISNYY